MPTDHKTIENAADHKQSALKVTFVSDITCPWCWVGKRHLDLASQQAGVPLEVTVEPFLINPDMPSGGEDLIENLLRKYGAAGPAMHKPLSAAGAKVGIAFKTPWASRMLPTTDAHRLAEWCKEIAPEKEGALAERLFELNFEKAGDVSRREELVAVATSVGLDATAAEKMLASERFADEVRGKARAWSRQGVSGVPFFIVHSASGKSRPMGFSGAQPIERIAQMLVEQQGA